MFRRVSLNSLPRPSLSRWRRRSSTRTSESFGECEITRSKYFTVFSGHAEHKPGQSNHLNYGRVAVYCDVQHHVVVPEFRRQENGSPGEPLAVSEEDGGNSHDDGPQESSVQAAPAAGVECVWAALFDSTGVYAGHCAAEALRSSVLKHIDTCEGDLHRAMGSAFVETHELVAANAAVAQTKSFTAALVVMIIDEELIVAAAGTSKAAWVKIDDTGRANNHLDLNMVHTGDVFSEKHRIVAQGGRVVGGIVNGQGRASRALGAHGGKGVIPNPDVATFRLVPDADNIVVVGTAALWDALGAKRAMRMVADGLVENPSIMLDVVARQVVQEAVASSSSTSSAIGIIILLARPTGQRSGSVSSAPPHSTVLPGNFTQTTPFPSRESRRMTR